MNLDQKVWACYLFANIHLAVDRPGALGAAIAFMLIGSLMSICDVMANTK